MDIALVNKDINKDLLVTIQLNFSVNIVDINLTELEELNIEFSSYIETYFADTENTLMKNNIFPKQKEKEFYFKICSINSFSKEVVVCSEQGPFQSKQELEQKIAEHMNMQIELTKAYKIHVNRFKFTPLDKKYYITVDNIFFNDEQNLEHS